MAELKEITWTKKRKKIAALSAQGKTFMQIVALGYSKDMTSKVLTALKAGQQPPERKKQVSEEGEPGDEDNHQEGDKSLVSVTGSKGSPIVFWLEQKKIALDPFELHKQYSYYTALANKNGGITNSFSQVLTLAMQVLWILLQDIPKDENMLKAIFYGAK